MSIVKSQYSSKTSTDDRCINSLRSMTINQMSCRGVWNFLYYLFIVEAIIRGKCLFRIPSTGYAMYLCAPARPLSDIVIVVNGESTARDPIHNYKNKQHIIKWFSRDGSLSRHRLTEYSATGVDTSTRGKLLNLLHKNNEHSLYCSKKLKIILANS